ncbi:hypothetical protein DFH09DRAFT_803712, partial [Mycena vulgaris]
IKNKYAAAIRELSEKKNGWHFDAMHATAAQLESFRIEDIAREIRLLAPELWELVGLMLSADQRLAADEDDPMTSDDEDIPKDLQTRAEKIAERRDALILIKRVVIISMMMQSANQKCNALESVFGIFLHASNTPSRVIEALAHMGISISEQSIERAVKSLSAESYAKLREMGQSLLVGYAYDNFDIDFGIIVPTVEKDTDTLTHMTSGDIIALEHGVQR